MSNRGRPRLPNSAHDLSGSKNARDDQITSGAMKYPDIPPVYLSDEAMKHWCTIVPGLVASEVAKEADRSVLAMLCASLARFHDWTVNAENLPIVSELERRNLGKTILEISDRFGLTPLSRARSGISKKVSGVKQRA